MTIDTGNSQKTIAFLVADSGIEEIELTSPWQAVEAAGFTPKLVSPHEGKVESKQGNTFAVDVAAKDAAVDDFAALVLPGGTVNPDHLRTDATSVAFVKDMVEAGKPVAAICHAPWVLAEADVLRGKRATSVPSIRTDVRNAGAEVVDEAVVIDGNLITSRTPDDLEEFNAALLAQLSTN